MRVLSMLAAALIAGCVSSGTQVKDAQLDQFQKGVTTEADVTKALGPAQSVSRTSDGKRILVYVGTHAQAKASSFIPVVGLFTGGATAHVTTVSFTFGPDGKLADYTSSESNSDVRTGIVSGAEATSPPK